MSHMTMTKILLGPGFYPQNSDLWERHPVINFSTDLHQMSHSLWEIPDSDHKVNTLVLVQIFTIDLVFDLLIG